MWWWCAKIFLLDNGSANFSLEHHQFLLYFFPHITLGYGVRYIEAQICNTFLVGHPNDCDRAPFPHYNSQPLFCLPCRQRAFPVLSHHCSGIGLLCRACLGRCVDINHPRATGPAVANVRAAHCLSHVPPSRGRGSLFSGSYLEALGRCGFIYMNPVGNVENTLT